MDPSYMKTVTMNELYETAYLSKPAIIDGILYPGTYLFVGAPKVGKSFMMAQLAYHVSTGKPLWENEVRQGNVLYLALEDDYSRLQKKTLPNVRNGRHKQFILLRVSKKSQRRTL